MTRHRSDRAFTIVELLVVMAIIGIIAAMALPALNSMITGQQASAARNLIRTALAQAQAHAAKSQKYAGIRFQFDKEGWRTGQQYLVLIEKAPEGNGASEYWAIPNARPIALPKGVGVISLDHAADVTLDDNTGHHDTDWANYDDYGLPDATTFTILFSPSGELVSKTVQVKNRNSSDVVFGEITMVNRPKTATPGPALLYGDNANSETYYPSWCFREMSARGFYLYQADAMQQTSPDYRFSNYVRSLEAVLINMYTGSLIDEDF